MHAKPTHPKLVELCDELETLLPEDLPLLDLCTLWLDLVAFREHLDVIVGSVREEATEAMRSEFGDDRRGVPIVGRKTQLETPAGVVRLDREPPRRRAHGRGIVEILSTPLVEANSGEVIRAVPVDVLRDVLPAAHADVATGYGWRWSELRERLGDEYPILVDEPDIADRPVRINQWEGWG